MNWAMWLTEKRIRIHALLLAVCLWTVYAVDMSAPGLLDRNGLIKGTDFLHFYTLGTLALQGRGDLLYDIQRELQSSSNLAAGSRGVVCSALRSAGFFVLRTACVVTVWMGSDDVAFGKHVDFWIVLPCPVGTCPALQGYRWTVLILAIAFPGFFHLIAWGQSSGLALLCFTLAYLALGITRTFWQDWP